MIYDREILVYASLCNKAKALSFKFSKRLRSFYKYDIFSGKKIVAAFVTFKPAVVCTRIIILLSLKINHADTFGTKCAKI